VSRNEIFWIALRKKLDTCAGVWYNIDAAIESTWAVDLDPSVDEGKNAIQLSWDRAKKMLGLE
jgi:hypothetical protein